MRTSRIKQIRQKMCIKERAMELQKNYRDFTIGELLDLGLDVEIKKHGLQSIEEGKAITNMFEGAKKSTRKVTKSLSTARAWKECFNVTVYIPTE